MIDEMVITEAKFLLHDLSDSVGQVADKLHFSDPYFFSRYFKKYSGISPKNIKASPDAPFSCFTCFRPFFQATDCSYYPAFRISKRLLQRNNYRPTPQ